MYDALRKLMKEDFIQAKNEGRLEERLELISNLMDSQKISADQAMDMVKIPVADREFFRTRLQ